MTSAPPATPEPDAEGTLQAALAALRSGRHDDAARLAGEMLAAEPGNVVAAQVLGHAALILGRPADAIAPLQSAARGGDPAIETLLARALAGAGRREAAIEQLQRTTERRPPFPLAFLELGELLGGLGRFDEAAAALERGLALAPDAAVLRVGLGQLHLRRNERAKARSLFLEVRAAAPDRHDALVALAGVMALDGEPAEAAALYRRALELRPGDALVMISLAKCLLEMGERDAAEVALCEAAQAAPRLAGLAITALAAASHGRFFLRPSDAASFLEGEGS